MTNANIIEGISNEALCCFTVFVATVVVCIINLVYSWNSGQNAGIRIPANSALSSTLNEDTQGNSTEDQRTGESIDGTDRGNLDPLSVHDDTNTRPALASAIADRSTQDTDFSQDGLHWRGDEQFLQNDNASAPPGDTITIRIKHMENDRTVSVLSTTRVAELKRLCFLDEINSGKTVRLIYSGRLLQDDNAPISFYGVGNCSVVHAQVSDIRRTRRDYEHSSTATQEADLDISKLFLPMLAIVLLFCWYGFFYYRHLFSAASVIILVFMTIAFGVLAYIMTS
ncbi:transmembrane and ubiquitin-like domain-containing protein 1 isoform X2 [Acropora millepora]|uniref:transmembrane and ubiquitin-like domain-containing protein 1 isoform X2 n=1 Tax=Acropora millepora TaxID=45264 RepID=UPI001CF367F0|nr:transmembrane and ubiquitin-like domain-containing protein 1 isoform X2 [Acropora millepora]